MPKYRHTVTGGVRESSSKLGFPWEPYEDEESSAGSKTKAELVAEAEKLGLDTSGTKAEIAARIADAG
jgi:SAP domain